jgi:uracil phosphoribosyltransferase
MSKSVIVIDHPLVQHKLTLMRRKETSTAEFRRLLREISALIGYEVTRDIDTEMVDIETPLAPMRAPILTGLKPVLVSILRAGGGILEGVLDVIPSARVGHIGSRAVLLQDARPGGGPSGDRRRPDAGDGALGRGGD